MDQRLYAAACSEDVGALLELLQEDPLILFAITLTTSNTPLHIAALLGHTELAKEAMLRNPELSRELNHHGYSPLHLASSKGYLQIVKDLLNIDKRLCLLKDRDGRTPLHCAAIKGRLDVVRQLLSSCPESAMEFTFKDETMLHLVVKNNQCELMISLLSLLREFNLVDELVNSKDEDGNTVLQLANAMKQDQIIKILSKETNCAVNSSSPEHQIPQTNEEQVVDIDCHDSHQSHTNSDGSSSRSTQRLSLHKKRDGRFLDSVKNGIIVLCSLFATFCFEAILNPPGGLWQNWPTSYVNNTVGVAAANVFTNSIILHIANLFSIFPFGGRLISNLNYTAPYLYLPGRAMSVVLDPYHFISFLYYNAVCFMASLATVILIMITSFSDNFQNVAVTTMTIIIILSAAMLYRSVLALVTGEDFAEWAMKVGETHLSMAFLLILIITFLVEMGPLKIIRNAFNKLILKPLKMIGRACCRIN